MNIIGKKFVVIGGAGLIGSHTIDKLLLEDVKEVIVYDNFVRGKHENLKEAVKDPRLKIYEIGGDITNTDILDSALMNADGVFHFAALWLLQCHEYPRSAFDVNIRGTFNVLEACVKNNVKKIVFSSSASVYGDAKYEPIDEEHPYDSKNFYGATKICCEAMLKSFYHRYNLDYVALRYMNVYGVRQDYHGAYIAVIMKMIDSIIDDKNPTIFGDGNESFDFVSVKDCAYANILAMKSKATNQNLNVGTGVSTSLRSLAELIIKLTNFKGKINYVPQSNKTLVKNRVGSTHKAKNVIDFKSQISIEEGLKDVLRWRFSEAKREIDIE